MTKKELTAKIAALHTIAAAMVTNGTATTNFQTGYTLENTAQVSSRLNRGINESRAKYQLESLLEALEYFLAYWVGQAHQDAIAEDADRQLVAEKAPIDLCNVNQLQESRDALAGCITKWGRMIEALEAGRMSSFNLVRFVIDEKVYTHGLHIDGEDGKKTTRIAQLLNNGEHRGQEFRSLVLQELKSTVAACEKGLPNIDAKLEEMRQQRRLEEQARVDSMETAHYQQLNDWGVAH